MTRLFIVLMACAVLCLNAFADAGSSGWVSTDTIHSQLVAQSRSVRAGQSFSVAWHIKMEPKWHVYWANPGDSGLPPTLSPANGFSAGALAFPTPMVIRIPPITNYGYEHETVLVSTFTAPATLPAGKVELPVALTYLYCSDEVCVPGRVTATLELTAGTGAPEANPAFDALLAQHQAALPKALPDGSHLVARNKGGNFVLEFDPSAFGQISSMLFIPDSDGIIKDSAAQVLTATDTEGKLTLMPDPQAATPPQSLKGVLLINGQGYTVPELVFTAPHAALQNPVSGFLFAVLSAFLAGLILNLMPCVLPVLALKAFALLKGHENRAAAYRHAAGYTLGVVGSFMLLGGATLALQDVASGIGWGFQLQQPLFVAGLCALMVALALSFFGVVEVGTSLTRLGHTGKGQHWLNDVSTGVLAVIVATPCTVPFMGGAVAFALTQPAPVTLGVFAALGLGLAAPLAAITLIPGLGRWLPKPGRWLEGLKQLLGWPLLATALWLLWVYHNQTDAMHFFTLLAALLLLAFGLWLYGRRPGWRRLTLLAGLLALGAYGVARPAAPPAHWQAWSAAEVEALSPHRPVFIDFTADWCLTCKVNEALVLNTTAAQTLFAQHNVALFRADWTMQNAEISAELEKHGRRGVPLYVLYKPGSGAVVLPQVLTLSALRLALQ